MKRIVLVTGVVALAVLALVYRDVIWNTFWYAVGVFVLVVWSCKWTEFGR